MKKISFKHLVLFFALVVAFASTIAIANAAAADYIGGYYTGTVSNEDGADVYKEPGSASEHLKDASGNNIHIPVGTELRITAEQSDPDLDVWYKVEFKLGDNTYEGFVFTGRVKRGDNVIEFTPTPTPSPSPTPEIVATAPSADEEPTVPESNNDNPAKGGKSGFEPYKYIIVLCTIIVVVMIIYTIWVKVNEEKLEKEIERYSGRSKYEPLEGELSEDFEEAKASYYDHIGLGDQTDKDLGEEIGNPEDIHLDMTGVFADEEELPADYEEEYIEEEFADDDSLENLIASLEDKIPEDNKQYDDYAFEDEAYEDSIGEPVDPALYLNSLNAGDILDHKVYGSGTVIDNTDDEIIQVEFAGNMKFLKKDKLVAKDLFRM